MHHLIFEGAELSGKSWIISQIYNHLEPKYNQGVHILDGCHWFNTDVGVYGTKYGYGVIKGYLEIFKVLAEKNILVEKFHLSDFVYQQINDLSENNYTEIENKLNESNFKIILIAMPEDETIVQKRLEDRLNLYPHYSRIKKDPSWYLSQQNKYLQAVKNSMLPYLIVPTESLPDDKPVKQILSWIKEL